jgi:hypothetical protein
MLFHLSEEPNIHRFDPRPAPQVDRPVVWAIREDRLRNYLLPRDCPRVTFFAGSNTSADDRERFLGTSDAVVAFEAAWLDRVRQTRLYCYHLPDASFHAVDECAGYFHSHEPVTPTRVEVIDDLLAALASCSAEIRIVPTLWPLNDAVVASTLSYSIIRMRNAAARAADSHPAASRNV